MSTLCIGKDVLLVMICSSMRLHIVHCHCFWNVHQDVRLILEMCIHLHSRLLERSAIWMKRPALVNITALPIIEARRWPFRICSYKRYFHHRWIFLESDLSIPLGMRPAVNVGLSVSRVGGAAGKAMKKAAGSVRIDLAPVSEINLYTVQFWSGRGYNSAAEIRKRTAWTSETAAFKPVRTKFMSRSSLFVRQHTKQWCTWNQDEEVSEICWTTLTVLSGNRKRDREKEMASDELAKRSKVGRRICR